MAEFPAPRVSYVPVADGAYGRAAAGLAAVAGVSLDGWQRLVLTAGCDRRGGKWSAFETVLVVSRQNGKTVCAAVRALAGCLLFGEKLVVYSAHEWRTVSEVFAAVLDLVQGSPLRRYVTRVRHTGGEEAIRFANGSRLRFMNRSRESARGFTADCVILDEAHAVSAAQSEALLPVLSARPDAQAWYMAHGPAPGAWRLAALRNRALSADPGRLCYLEWSADSAGNLDDEAVWLAANPAAAAGRLSLERMRDERRTLGADGFAAERLAAGPWPSEDAGAWELFTPADWQAMTGGTA
jgi:phage terminase large subunit-like protein